jgi:uncharacterized membrane protein YcaP (DUF421 family)
MQVILRTALIYVLLLVILRVTSRRVSRSMTPLDMVILFLFGGMVSQSILGEDRSLTNSLLAIATVSLLHLSISVLKRRLPIIGRITEGTPVVVYQNGAWDEKRLSAIRIYKGDVMVDVRQNGLSNLDQVDKVVVEPNGGISVLTRRED